MKKILVFLCILLFLQSALFAGDEKNVVTADLKFVTVYRSGAELTHTAKAVLKQGNNDLVIEGVSNGLDINSVQVGCNEKVTILSVEFSTDYLKPSIKSFAVKKLEDSIVVLTKELSQVQVMLNTDRELLDLLKANKEIRGTQTGLSVAELAKMMEYYKKETLEVQKEMAQFREKENKINEVIQRIRMQVVEEEQKNNKAVGKLILQLLSPMPVTANFTISYFTLKAYWTAFYDIRVESIDKPISLSYKAKLVQTTGINWRQVKLKLVTSTPNQNSIAPILKSWFLNYVDPVTRMENNLYMNSIQALQGRTPGVVVNSSLQEVEVTGYGATDKDIRENAIRLRGTGTLASKFTPIYILNGQEISQSEIERIAPKNIKSVDVLKQADATAKYGAKAAGGAIEITLKDDLGDFITIKNNELNVIFDIELPYDVNGNGKEQIVSLKDFQVKTFFKYYSVPKLDKDAYLLGEVADWSQLNLLPGEANINFEGTYIGKSFIDPNSINDTLNLTLGRDKRIAIRKEKLKDYSSIKFLGNYKKQVFTYEITVKNNKNEPIQMLLKDQYPLSTNKEIEVELMDGSEAINNVELGVLSWKLKLAPGEIKKVRISYSIKYPKDKFINLGQ